jgi:outer membrane receptor protein involved in Fe transport
LLPALVAAAGLVLGVVGMSAAAPAAHAQDTGRVVGTVVDGDGSALPGAQVTVVGTQLGTVTGGDGTYRIAGVPAGTQQVQARFVGFTTETQAVDVPADGEATADFQLQTNLLQMEEAIVTGAFNPREKIESSVAITTLSAADIATQAPQSTADLLKAIPGFYVESSGGEGGNNLFARGIPADGSFRYVAMQHNGMPVYDSPELAFTNVDLLFRVDETVQRMEGVRGGTASVFASNAPAGIVNFVSQTGGPELEGLVKVSGATRGKLRTDLNLGGPLSENWRFNVGGFYRYDEGVRYAGFPGNRGGQLNANVTRLLDDGYVRVYGRYLNDQNIFYLPVPVQDPDNPESLPGFDANYGTMTNLDAGLARVPAPDGVGRTSRDLTRGMNPVLGSLQTDLFFELDNGVTIENKTMAMQADVTFNAIFSLNNPFDAEGYAQELVDATPGAVGFAYDYTYDENRTFDPADANGNGLVAETGWWHVDKPLSNFANEFRVGYQAGPHALSGGLYFSTYSATELWHWNDILSEVRDRPRMLDLTLLDATGAPVARATENGFRRYGTLYRSHSGTGTVIAGFAGDEFQVSDKLRIDVAGRLERGTFRGKVEETTDVDLDGDPTTLFDNSFSTGTDAVGSYSFQFDEWAASVGVNYAFSDQLAVFGRGSRGFRMPDFDEWADGTVGEKGTAEDIWQGEVGVKINSPTVAVFAAAFVSSLTDIPFADEVQLGSGQNVETVPVVRFADSQTFGLETEIIARFGNLRTNLTATIQNPEYTGLTFDDPAILQRLQQDPDVDPADFDFDGNRVRRIPQYIVNLRPTYTLTEALELFVVGKYYGERFVDDANNVTLPDYVVFDAGATATLGSVEVRLVGTNLSNTVGLTEGNPRSGQVVGVEQDIYMARPILGRRFQLALTYRF